MRKKTSLLNESLDEKTANGWSPLSWDHVSKVTGVGSVAQHKLKERGMSTVVDLLWLDNLSIAIIIKQSNRWLSISLLISFLQTLQKSYLKILLKLNATLTLKIPMLQRSKWNDIDDGDDDDNDDADVLLVRLLQYHEECGSMREWIRTSLWQSPQMPWYMPPRQC